MSDAPLGNGSRSSKWFKSTFSASTNCVTVRIGEDVSVRDSKDLSEHHLVFTHDEWRAFIAGVKAGEFDLS